MQQPFSARSAWNVTIPADARYADAGGLATVGLGIDVCDSAGLWAVPCHVASAADPQRPLLYNPAAWAKVATGDWRRFDNRPEVERAILQSSVARFPYAGNVFSSVSTARWQLPDRFNAGPTPGPGPGMFRAGAAARPAGGPDGHMAVAQPAGTVLETYATIILGSGQIVALSYSVTDPCGLGDGWQNGQTASMLPIYAGLIATNELRGGIGHAMAVTLPAPLLQARVVYPAFAFDRDAASGIPAYAGIIPMGGRLALPPAARIGDLGLRTAEGMAIAEAACRHGFIVVDRGGEGITLRMRAPDGPMDRQAPEGCGPALRADLRRIFARVRQVDFPLAVQ